MSSLGRSKGAYNVRSFEEFVSRHNHNNDWQAYLNSSRKNLRRELICEECGFGKSALIQNSLLKEKFEELVSDLRIRGILVSDTSQQPDFRYFEQETFIKAFEDMIKQFNSEANFLKEVITLYSQELDILD